MKLFFVFFIGLLLLGCSDVNGVSTIAIEHAVDACKSHNGLEYVRERRFRANIGSKTGKIHVEATCRDGSTISKMYE